MSYQTTRRDFVANDAAAITESPNVPRSTFIGRKNRLTTFDAGYLIPIFLQEILPGDHMTYRTSCYVRMSTPLFPLMMNQRLDVHWFFVPNRLVWEHWVNFQGEMPTPSSSGPTSYTVPPYQSSADGDAVCSLADYLGLPVKGQIAAADRLTVSALPFRAYYRIWNEWYRDQNIQSPAPQFVADTGETPGCYDPGVLRRDKTHDYFTSALPYTQKFTSPYAPLAGMAPVLGIGAVNPTGNAGPQTAYETPAFGIPGGGATVNYAYYKNLWDVAAINQTVMKMSGPSVDATPLVYADLSQATGIAINTLRNAFLTQALLERDARSGTRYPELIFGHFRVQNPDFRLQRPEFIGGGSASFNITPIAQTAPTTGLTVGALGAAGTATSTHSASYAATEHGWIMALASVKTELAYQQGVHKMWRRATRYEYYLPALAQLGEQAILNEELYTTGDSDPNKNLAFGYQERWHEYRTLYSDVTGVFKSFATGTIDAWHLAQNFTSLPTLSEAFLQDNPPMTRVLAAGASAAKQQYIGDFQFDVTMVRAIPTFGTPAILGRF